MKTPILTALLVIINILPALSATTASFTPQFAQAENTISQPSQYQDSIAFFDDDDEDDDGLSAAEIQHDRGVKKYKSGDKRGALLDFNKAIALDPKFANAYEQRGEIKSDFGDKRGALVDFNRAISLDSKNAYFYCHRGTLKLNLDDKRGALSDFDRAIVLNPNYADAYQNRGIATSLLNNNRSGLVDLKQAADIYRQQGKMESYQRVMALIQKLSG